jgi:NADH-quinone oxidoreductase subunit H
MSGWSSNSKYAFFGAIRAAAQMISYEVSMGLILLSVILCVGDLNLTSIVMAQKEI